MGPDLVVSLPARPEPFELRCRASALVIVDMQNAYCSPEGYLDLAGFDISAARPVIEAVTATIGAARAVGMPVVYLQNGWDPDYREAGGPGSPNWAKSNALRLMRQRQELSGRLLAKGSWDYQLVDELKPAPDEYVVQKPRYSGFWATNLDQYLRARGVRTLVFAGVATNVCVESTLRDAFFLEYFPVLVADACFQAGPRFLHEATVYNVERFFGWVTTVAELRAALQATGHPDR